MKLFLSSAGIQPETKQAFLDLIEKDPKDCKVAFIPTGADPQEKKQHVQRTIDQIEDLGMSLFKVDLKIENEQSLYEKLSPADAICVNGGNTFYLLDWVKKSGFDKVAKRLLNEGKIYFGISAGSYIACPTIEVSNWRNHDNNTIDLKDLSAMNLVDFLMFVHYSQEWIETVEDGYKTTQLPVVVLTDKQAIVVNGDKISLAGPQEVLTFNNFKLSQ